MKSTGLIEKIRKANRHKQIIWLAALIALAIVGISFLSQGNLTGLGVVNQPTNVQNLNLVATENQDYAFELENFPENASVSSVGLTGSIIGEGAAKVYLVSDNQKLLILDSSEVKKDIGSSITGFSAADESSSPSSGESSSAQPESPSSSDNNANMGSSDTGTSDSGAEQPSAPTEQQPQTPETPTETPPVETPPVEPPAEEVPPTEEIPPTETPPAEQPLAEQPQENQTETPQENVTVPEENVTLPEENVTLPEENLTIQEYGFENFCIDTCYLPEGFTDNNYILEIEVEEGTTLKLDSLDYVLSVPEVPIVNQTNETVFFETTIVDANNNAVPAVIEFVDSQTKNVEAIGKSEQGDPTLEDISTSPSQAEQSSAGSSESSDSLGGGENSAQPELPSSSTDNASIGSDTEPSNSGAENSRQSRALIQGAAVAEPETAQPAEAPIVEASGEPGLDIPKGKYNIKVTLQNNPIKEIEFTDIDVTQNITDFIKIDNPPETDNFIEIYAIDPTQFSFTTAIVTGTAVGDSLYKCKDWDFASRTCTGNWIKIMDLTPGQEYSFVLTPDDPAFAQLTIQQCNGEDNQNSPGTWGACDNAYPGTALFDDDATYETHTFQRQGSNLRWAGLRTNSSNTTITNCISISQAYFCYKWWADSNHSTNCDISVDANNGASYSAVTTTCPQVGEPASVTCTNVTGLETWTCGNFFGTTGALAKSEVQHDATAGNDVHTVTWDVFYFNVSYTIDNAPNSTLVSPTNGNVTTSNNVTFSCNATDDIKLSNITFYWNYTGTFQANGTTSVSGTSNSTTFARTNLSNGAILWNCQACDNISQCSFASANWTVTVNTTVADTTAPIITVITPSPSNNSFINSTSVIINASIVDSQSNIDVCTLNFDGSNSTMTKNGAGLSVTCNSTQSSLSQGLHNFTVFANDTASNTGSNGTWFFTVDTIFPQIQFVTPTETSGSVLNRTNILVNVTATDLNLTNITVYLYNSTSLINSTTTLASPNFANFTNLTNGLYYFNATALDLVGNSNSTETRNVTINVTINLPPTSNSPSDQIVDLGQKSTISWILQDDVAPGYYYVLKDGVLFEGPATWLNNTQIIVRPNNFFLGNHNYTIYYNDSAGNNGIPDTVFVNVVDSSTPSCSGVSSPLTLTNITIDGNMEDWFAVLSNTNNYRHDEPSGSGDLDVVGTADRDLTEFAYTWDSQYLYFYFKRVSSGTNVISVMAYLDYGLDGYMNSTDKVIKFVWHGSNGQWDSDLYNYNPVGVGDLMNGSGYDLPGSITENQSLEDNIPGSTSPGIQLEARVAWSALGFSGPRAINFQPASAQGTGTNLPSQIEDNIDTISSQYASFLFSPDNMDSALNGTSVYYAHDLMNCGISGDTIDMTKVSNQGWTITLYYPNGTALTDTDSDGKVDMPLGTNNFTTLIAKIDVPSATSMGVIDVSTITATSSVVSSESKNVKDTTATGQIAITPSTRTIYGAPGMTAVLNYTVYNYQSFADVIEIEASSNQGWTANLYYANGTSITDTDSDSHADVGSLLAGESKDIVLKLNIPSGASIGTNDLTTIRINSSVTSAITTTASANTTVKNRLTIEPDYNRSIGLGDATYYLLTITNSWNQSDTIDLTHTYVLNWNTTFYDFDSTTLLTDTDSDGKVDIGSLSGYGAQKDIYAKVRSPSNATNNQNETTTVYANSSLNTSVYDTVVLITTARTVNTFANVARTTPKTNFEVGDVVYARAFNLLSVTNAYYHWIDSNGTVIRISSNIPVDSNMQADDQLSTNTSMLSGTWTIVVFNAHNDVELGRINFVLNDTSPPNIAIISPQNTTYNNRTQLINISTSGATNIWYNWNGTNISYTGTVYVTFAEGANTLYAYANDSAGNSNSTFVTFTADTAVPTISNLFPANNSLDPNGNIMFNASVADNVALKNASLYINGILNQTQSLSGTSNITSFNLNLPNGNYNWSIRVYDNGGNYANSEIRLLIVNTNALPIYTNFTGNTTDWPNVPDLTNVCNGTAVIDNPITDKIQWHNCINASGQNFDINVNLSYNFVDALFGLNPTFNSSATITMRGLPWDATPDILMDGAVCNATICQNVNYTIATGLLVFDVPHFTNFTTQGNSRLEIWDETDTGMPFGGQTKYPNDQVKFFANYTKKTDGSPFTGATCIINFTDSSGNSMTYNATSLIYEYNRTFSTSGIKPYNVTCSKTGAQTITLTDSANISVAIDHPPFWSSNQSSIVATYSPSTQSYFNITWGDDTGVSKVYLESNYSGSAQNYSMNLILGSATNGVYNYSAILPAGTYYWKSHANDTANQWNSSDTWSFTIDKATPILTLIASPAWTVINGTQTNVSCSADTAQVIPLLYRNGTNVSNPDVQTFAIGTYNYICNNTATQNYTSTSNSNPLIVTAKTISACSLSFNPASPQTYPTPVNASCSCTNPETAAKLYRDGADVTVTENNVFKSLAAENYSYICNVTETGNWSTASNSSIYELDPAITVLNLTASPSWNETYPTATTVNCSANNVEVVLQLYVDGAPVGIPYTTTHTAGPHSYVCNNTASQNYTSESASNTLTINKAATTTQLYLDGSEANETVVYPTQTNATAVTSAGTVTLYRDNNPTVSNPEIITLAAGTTYNYTAVNFGDTNYLPSSETWFLIVQQNTTTCNIVFDLTQPQTYGTAINASCSCTNPEAVAKLYRNGDDVTSTENNVGVVLAAQTHDYVCNVTASDNYTSTSTSASYLINPATGIIYLYLNGSRANFTTPNNTYVNISAALVNGTGDIQVYDGGIQIYSGPSPSQNMTLFDALGSYNITAESLGSQNFTVAYETWWVSVVDITPPTVQFVAPTPLNNANVTGIKPITVTASDPNLASIEIFLDGGSVQLCPSPPCTYNFDTTVLVEESIHNFTATATDSYNNTASTEIRYYKVDNTAPNITYVSPTPANDSTVNTSSVTITTTVYDLSGVDKCILEFDGANVSTISSTVGTCNFTRSSLSNGTTHTFRVYANDTTDPMGAAELRVFHVNLPVALPEEEALRIRGASAPVYVPPTPPVTPVTPPVTPPTTPQQPETMQRIAHFVALNTTSIIATVVAILILIGLAKPIFYPPCKVRHKHGKDRIRGI